MRRRAWMFCSARFSAALPPCTLQCCGTGRAGVVQQDMPTAPCACLKRQPKQSRAAKQAPCAGQQDSPMQHLKRGVRPVMRANRLVMADTIESILTLRWCAPTCAQMGRVRRKPQHEGWQSSGVPTTAAPKSILTLRGCAPTCTE